MWKGKYTELDFTPECKGMAFDVDAVRDDWEGFRIWFRPHDTTKGMLIASFDSELFYSSSDEGDRLAPVDNDISNKGGHLLWKVTDSRLVEEFKRQTLGVRAKDDIHHYCFMTQNQAVDVLMMCLVCQPPFSLVITAS